MHDDPGHLPARKHPENSHRFVRWVRRRHRAALGLMLRGACHGLGTGAVGLTAFWLQHRL